MPIVTQKKSSADASQSAAQAKEPKKRKNKAKKQTSVISAISNLVTTPAANKGPSGLSQSNQKQPTISSMHSPGKSLRQTQQEVIIENYNDLAKKFTDLNAKYFTLTQQLQVYST